jgi:hypothetical protein
MKKTILRDDVIAEKQNMVIKARTVLISDDFGNPRQRFSEMYFVYIGSGNTDEIGLTQAELNLISQRFKEYLFKHGEE